jgi:hypothetical protein
MPSYRFSLNATRKRPSLLSIFATGKPYTTISKSFKRLMKKAGLEEDVTCHTSGTQLPAL